MILVLLGTQNNSFHRLLKKVENLIESGKIKEDVVVQAGHTKYTSNKMQIFDFMKKEELEEYVSRAQMVITHGGVGSILLAINKNKKVIAVPRLHEYDEHINNHQIDIVNKFSEKGYIIGIQGIEELEKAIIDIKNFKPKEYKADNYKMLKIIEDFIESV